MAKVASARDLFPPPALFERFLCSGAHTQYARQLREIALQKSTSFAPSDKELHRFMPSQIDWEALSSAPEELFGCQYLQDGSWISDFESLPSIPAQLESVKDMFEQPCSIAHLVGATFTSGRVIYVPEGSTCTFDLVKKGVGGFSSELLIIIIESGATVTIMQSASCVSGLSARLVVGFIGSHSTVNVIANQDYTDTAFSMSQEIWHVGTQAHLKSISAVTGGKQTWRVNEFTLQDGAHSEHVSLAALKAQEQSALITHQRHLGAGSHSSVKVKSVLMDKSAAFYRGMIEIDNKATMTSADQQQRSLLLSPTARSCAIPSFEVATDNVQCKHGSAAGHFNAEEMTYLLSRGFTHTEATRLLIQAFYREQLTAFDASVVEALCARLEARLGDETGLPLLLSNPE